MFSTTIQSLFTITKFSHFFKVTRVTPQGRQLLDTFLVKYVQKSFKPQQPLGMNHYGVAKEVKDKVYGIATRDLQEYRFHMGQFAKFQEFLTDKGFDQGFYFTDETEIHQPSLIKTKIRPFFSLRDRQPDVVDFLLRDLPGDLHSRLVTLPTGYGKGLIALYAICERKYRTLYILLPRYIDKTAIEIKEKTNAMDKDIMVVQGSDALRGLIDLGQTGQYKNDFCIISINTWMMFIDSYISDPDQCMDEYGCHPEDVYRLLGIGTVLIDEIHQYIHAVYRTFCFMNQDRAIGLSATFLSADQFIDNMQKTMFPREIRFEAVKAEKHIRAYGISYNISQETMKRLRTSERGSSSYSQNAFEHTILKHKPTLEKYLSLVKEVIDNGFMDNYKPGYKCVIFCRRVDMCEAMVEFLRRKFPDLNIKKYTEGDPYKENLLDADIRVTTQQSAGTAHDIPGLMTNITFDNMGSQQSNLQCLGRLRPPKEGVARYFAVFSESVPKHVKYHRDRKELFADSAVLTFKDFKSNISL